MRNAKAAALFAVSVVAVMAAVAIIDRVSNHALTDAINSIRGTKTVTA